MSNGKSDLLKKCITDLLRRNDLTLAISTGTRGPFRKITAMIMDSVGNVLGYVKIGETPRAIQRIKHEAAILKSLEGTILNSKINMSTPQCLHEGEIGKAYVMVQSPAPFEGKSGSKYFNEDYAEVLKALINNTITKKKFIDSEFYKEIKDGTKEYPLSYRDLLKGGLDCIEKTISNREIPLGLSHGDFAPWNTLWNKNEVFLYDWESACFEAPVGIDFIHFLFYTGWLIKGKKGEYLYDYITGNDKEGLKAYNLLREKIGNLFCEARILLLLYLLRISIENDKDDLLGRDAQIRREIMKVALDKQN